MAVVNGPNGRDEKRGAGPILRDVMRCRRLCYSRRGQALVETALLIPLLMLLVMGSADLGRVFYYSIAVTNAARDYIHLYRGDSSALAESLGRIQRTAAVILTAIEIDDTASERQESRPAA